MTHLLLPMPPSANRLWRMMRGHMVKSGEYRAWMDKAADAVTHQLGGAAPIAWFTICLGLPVTRRDPDNAIKPTLDAIQHGGAILDDSKLRGLTLDVHDDQPAEWIRVDIYPAPAPAAVQAREEAAHRAWECANVLLADFRSGLTPHTMERARKVAAMNPENIRPELAAATIRLYSKVAGVRA